MVKKLKDGYTKLGLRVKFEKNEYLITNGNNISDLEVRKAHTRICRKQKNLIPWERQIKQITDQTKFGFIKQIETNTNI